MKPRDIVIIGGLAAFAIWYLRKQASAAADAVISLPGNVGSAIGSTLYDWIHPGDGLGINDTYYTVTFPNGQRHAIPANTVGASGTFDYAGVNYLMKKDAAGQNVAVYA